MNKQRWNGVISVVLWSASIMLLISGYYAQDIMKMTNIPPGVSYNNKTHPVVMFGALMILLIVCTVWSEKSYVTIKKLALPVYITGVCLLLLLKTPLGVLQNGGISWLGFGKFLVIRPCIVLLLGVILMLGAIWNQERNIDVAQKKWLWVCEVIFPGLAVFLLVCMDQFAPSYLIIILMAMLVGGIYADPTKLKIVFILFWMLVVRFIVYLNPLRYRFDPNSGYKVLRVVCTRPVGMIGFGLLYAILISCAIFASLRAKKNRDIFGAVATCSVAVHFAGSILLAMLFRIGNMSFSL